MKKKVRNTFLPQDIAVLAAIMAVGVALLLLGTGWLEIGVLIIAAGLLVLPFYRHGYKLEGEKGTFRLKEITLSREDKTAILAYLSGESETLAMEPSRPGGGALVEVYRRPGDGLMLARYFDYAEHVAGKDYPFQEISQQQVEQLESMSQDKK